MAIFPGLLVVGINLILFMSGKTKNGVMNLRSHLCSVIELNLRPRHSYSSVRFFRAFVEIPRYVTLPRSTSFLSALCCVKGLIWPVMIKTNNCIVTWSLLLRSQLVWRLPKWRHLNLEAAYFWHSWTVHPLMSFIGKTHLMLGQRGIEKLSPFDFIKLSPTKNLGHRLKSSFSMQLRFIPWVECPLHCFIFQSVL